MDSFSNNIYGVDRINQSVTVLGGATAQSYGTVGLNKPTFDTESFTPVHDRVADVPPEDLTDDSPDGTSATIMTFVDSTSLVSALNLPAGVAFDEQFEPPVFSQTNEIRDSELMSRFEAVGTELPAAFGLATAQNGTSGDADSAVDGPAANAGSSLLSFLEQVIAQVEASQAEFNGSLDGDRQSFIRDSIENIGSDAGSTLRTTLQNNVADRGRELLMDGIEISGLTFLDPVAKPVLGFDYYGASADLINTTLDAVAQPIGSFSLPPVGPALTSANDELASFAS